MLINLVVKSTDIGKNISVTPSQEIYVVRNNSLRSYSYIKYEINVYFTKI